jgi:GTPase SAR1 family protein
MTMLSEEQFEAIRNLFFNVTNLDIHCLEVDEIRNLLELLPLVLVALHHENDLTIVYEADSEDDGPDPADMYGQ